MDYKEKATILRVCSSKEGERCSHYPAFGQGNRHCRRNAMRYASVAITELLARAEEAEARAEKAERERLTSRYIRWSLMICTLRSERTPIPLQCGIMNLSDADRRRNNYEKNRCL